MFDGISARRAGMGKGCMRLYLKFAAVFGLTIAVQWSMKHPQRGQEMWFAARCHFAFVTDDEDMKERLIEEARDSLDAPACIVAAAGPSN